MLIEREADYLFCTRDNKEVEGAYFQHYFLIIIIFSFKGKFGKIKKSSTK